MDSVICSILIALMRGHVVALRTFQAGRPESRQTLWRGPDGSIYCLSVRHGWQFVPCLASLNSSLKLGADRNGFRYDGAILKTADAESAFLSGQEAPAELLPPLPQIRLAA